MSSEDPIRSVPDELFRKVSARPERQLPDALFGGPPPAPREPEATSERPSGAESGGASEPAEGSDAEDDGSVAAVGVLVTESEPQAHAGSVIAPAVGQDSASEPTAEFVGGLDESVTAVDAVDAVEAVEAVDAAEAAGSPVSTGAVGGPAVTNAPADSGAAELHPAVVIVAESVSPAPESAAEVAIESRPRALTAIEDAVTQDDADERVAEPAKSAEGPAEAREAARPVLLVIADSLSYFGPKGGLPADHPRIWPNLVAAELDWDVELVGRIGWTCRDAYWALIGDPRVWAAVPRAGAVVFAVGGMDTLPSPLPTALRELIRYVRPPALRRVVRATYNWLQPKLSKLGRPVALPPKVSVDYLEQSRTALAQLRPDLPVVAVLPSVHDCAAYGRVHSGRPRAVEALRAWSGRTSVPLVDLGEAVRDNIFSGEANPDGIHWGWDGHAAVANAMVKTLQEVR